jgi:hypothetical protein
MKSEVRKMSVCMNVHSKNTHRSYAESGDLMSFSVER